MIAASMKHSTELREFIEGWEGLRCEAYDDGGGVWTIGIGRTTGVRRGDTCTEEQAREWFDMELEDYERWLWPYIERQPSQQQWDALISLSYNCGVKAIGKSGLMELYNAGDDARAADRFLMWNKDGGRVVEGLTNRRKAERRIYKFGDYSGRP